MLKKIIIFLSTLRNKVFKPKKFVNLKTNSSKKETSQNTLVKTIKKFFNKEQIVDESTDQKFINSKIEKSTNMKSADLPVDESANQKFTNFKFTQEKCDGNSENEQFFQKFQKLNFFELFRAVLFFLIISLGLSRLNYVLGCPLDPYFTVIWVTIFLIVCIAIWCFEALTEVVLEDLAPNPVILAIELENCRWSSGFWPLCIFVLLAYAYAKINTAITSKKKNFIDTLIIVWVTLVMLLLFVAVLTNFVNWIKVCAYFLIDNQEDFTKTIVLPEIWFDSWTLEIQIPRAIELAPELNNHIYFYVTSIYSVLSDRFVFFSITFYNYVFIFLDYLTILFDLIVVGLNPCFIFKFAGIFFDWIRSSDVGNLPLTFTILFIEGGSEQFFFWIGAEHLLKSTANQDTDKNQNNATFENKNYTADQKTKKFYIIDWIFILIILLGVTEGIFRTALQHRMPVSSAASIPSLIYIFMDEFGSFALFMFQFCYQLSLNVIWRSGGMYLLLIFWVVYLLKNNHVKEQQNNKIFKLWHLIVFIITLVILQIVFPFYTFYAFDRLRWCFIFFLVLFGFLLLICLAFIAAILVSTAALIDGCYYAAALGDSCLNFIQVFVAFAPICITADVFSWINSLWIVNFFFQSHLCLSLNTYLWFFINNLKYSPILIINLLELVFVAYIIPALTNLYIFNAAIFDFFLSAFIQDIMKNETFFTIFAFIPECGLLVNFYIWSCIFWFEHTAPNLPTIFYNEIFTACRIFSLMSIHFIQNICSINTVAFWVTCSLELGDVVYESTLITIFTKWFYFRLYYEFAPFLPWMFFRDVQDAFQMLFKFVDILVLMIEAVITHLLMLVAQVIFYYVVFMIIQVEEIFILFLLQILQLIKFLYNAFILCGACYLYLYKLFSSFIYMWFIAYSVFFQYILVLSIKTMLYSLDFCYFSFLTSALYFLSCIKILIIDALFILFISLTVILDWYVRSIFVAVKDSIIYNFLVWECFVSDVISSVNFFFTCNNLFLTFLYQSYNFLEFAKSISILWSNLVNFLFLSLWVFTSISCATLIKLWTLLVFGLTIYLCLYNTSIFFEKININFKYLWNSTLSTEPTMYSQFNFLIFTYYKFFTCS